MNHLRLNPKFNNMMNFILGNKNIEMGNNLKYYHFVFCESRVQSQSCLDYAEMEQSVRSKHFGSASWITDGTGNAIQHIQYCPFGEPFVNEHASFASYSERFTFTGKERDEETGYGYFGARYYNADSPTGWMSVDPMSDKYPSLSPYNYCAWNPVRLIDPNGRKIDSIAPGLESLVYEILHNAPDLCKQLKDSPDLYRIVYGNLDKGGGGAFLYVPNVDDPSSGYMEISIISGTSNYGKFSIKEKLAHELRHAKQYEDGQLGFIVQNGTVNPIGYDRNDEVECYEYADRNNVDIKSRRSHNEWVCFVNYNYSKIDPQCPQTPLEFIYKYQMGSNGTYQDLIETVKRFNSSGKRTAPYYKFR